MVEIKAPSSKSYAQRAIVCATLAQGQSVIRSVGYSDDVQAAITTCRSLGATIVRSGDDLHITGATKFQSQQIDVGESGLLTRLITPIVACRGAGCEIIGRNTLLNRPMHSLIAALDQLGVRTVSNNNFLPLGIEKSTDPSPQISIDGSDSSQVLSGLLMTLPFLQRGTTIVVENLRSTPYVAMTIDTLRNFGVDIENTANREFRLGRNDHYCATTYVVEGDWSGASYFLVADAIAGGSKIKTTGLNDASLQADCAILDALNRAKNLQGFEFDATHCPDLFPALVALASHCEGESRIGGTDRLAHKESARDIVLQCQWAKFGINIDLRTPNVMTIEGAGNRSLVQRSAIDPHGDHRIAMAASIMGRNVEVTNQDVVNKSYPQFWDDLHRIEHLLM